MANAVLLEKKPKEKAVEKNKLTPENGLFIVLFA